MYNLVLAANLLIWVALVLRSLSQPRADEFHPAGYYLVFHGIFLVALPILAEFWRIDFLLGVYQFAPSERYKSTVFLGSLFVAGALQLAQGRNYNLQQDHWRFLLLCAISAILVFVFAYATPTILVGMQEQLKSGFIF